MKKPIPTPIYDAMISAIDECHKIDEVENLQDKMAQLKEYARQANDMEPEKKARKIRIRAEREVKKLLKGKAP